MDGKPDAPALAVCGTRVRSFVFCFFFVFPAKLLSSNHPSLFSSFVPNSDSSDRPPLSHFLSLVFLLLCVSYFPAGFTRIKGPRRRCYSTACGLSSESGTRSRAPACELPTWRALTCTLLAHHLQLQQRREREKPLQIPPPLLVPKPPKMMRRSTAVARGYRRRPRSPPN